MSSADELLRMIDRGFCSSSSRDKRGAIKYPNLFSFSWFVKVSPESVEHLIIIDDFYFLRSQTKLRPDDGPVEQPPGGVIPLIRLFLIISLFLLPHCSASPDAGMLKGIEKFNFETEGDGQPEILRKIGETSDEPKGEEYDPEKMTPRAQPQPEPGTPETETTHETKTEEQDPKESPPLPTVLLESDKAMVPIVGLAEPKLSRFPPPNSPANVIERIVNIPAITFTKQLGDGNIDLTCALVEWTDSKQAPEPVLCKLTDDRKVQKSVKPGEFSWTVKVTQCPSARILSNVILIECSYPDASRCSKYLPAAQIGFANVDVFKCLADGAQLIFTLTEKATGRTSSVTLNLETTEIEKKKIIDQPPP